MTAPRYRCKHVVEALRWTDTDENRERFADWFDSHGAFFETRGPVVLIPEECGEAKEGEWIMYWDNEFVVMDDESFLESYEPVGAP